VYGDLASITRANASAIRSVRGSSTATTAPAGSQADTSGRASVAQNSRSRRTVPNASTRAGSNQRPRRRRATPQAARTPPAAWKISTVWARQRIRPSSGISSPASPAGWPRPSQCSSSAWIAAAVPSDRKSMRAISAPRSQRACISDRVTSPSARIAPRREARSRSEPSIVRRDHTRAEMGRDQSTSFDVRFASPSSAPNSAAIRAAFAEQPASLSSSA
jgi:hypothetical protein